MTETPLSELLAREADRDRAILQAALDAIDACNAAQADEDDRFRRYFQGELHGNSVRAAERRTSTASQRAHDAVSAAAKIAPAIAEVWGYSTQEEEVRMAVLDARLDVDARLAHLRGSIAI